MVWFHIRFIAREQQAIASFQQHLEIDFRAERRHEHGDGIRAERDGRKVLLAGHMEVMLSNQAAVGGDSDERLTRHV
jgi:hypothetical protein